MDAVIFIWINQSEQGRNTSLQALLLTALKPHTENKQDFSQGRRGLPAGGSESTGRYIKSAQGGKLKRHEVSEKSDSIGDIFLPSLLLLPPSGESSLMTPLSLSPHFFSNLASLREMK